MEISQATIPARNSNIELSHYICRFNDPKTLYMIKTRFMLLILAVIPIVWMSTSCGHKDDHAKPSSKIIGEWDGYKVIVHSYQNNQLMGSDTEALVPPDYITFKFNSDSTVSIAVSLQGDDVQQVGYYTVSGNKILISDSQDASILTSYPYKLTGNQMELIIIDTGTQNNVPVKIEYHFFLMKQ